MHAVNKTGRIFIKLYLNVNTTTQLKCLNIYGVTQYSLLNEETNQYYFLTGLCRQVAVFLQDKLGVLYRVFSAFQCTCKLSRHSANFLH